jgi:hypothetical protein
MSDFDTDMTDEELAEFEQAVAEERRRELAVEHLLFQTLSFLEGKHPGLLDHLESSIANLGDSADDDTKDDEAVREIARLFIASLRAGA